MARVKAKSVNQLKRKILDPKKEADKICAEVCFYYPIYTLAQARRLPNKDVRLLLRTARNEQARQNFELLQITAAPHTVKGKGLKQLSDHYKKIMKDYDG